MTLACRKLIIIDSSEQISLFTSEISDIDYVDASAQSLVFRDKTGKKISRRLPENCLDLAVEVSFNISVKWVELRKFLIDNIGTPDSIVCIFNHPLREFFLYWKKIDDIEFGLYFITIPYRLSQVDYALLTSANSFSFLSQDIFIKLKDLYVGPFISSSSEIDSDTPNVLMQHHVESPPSPLAPGQDDKRRLLVVSYFSGPCRSVGVQRVNYWFDMLETISNGRYEVHLATAIDWGSMHPRIHYVADLNVSCLVDEFGRLPDWAMEYIRLERQNSRCFNTLSSYWSYALEQYFNAREYQFDVVLISGNPFSVFDFARYSKSKWYARTVLDYRDPFSLNPRFNYSSTARECAKYFEQGLNFQADRLLVVNAECASLLATDDRAKISIVPNGFDERFWLNLEPLKSPRNRIRLVHAGSFYAYGSPLPLMQVVEKLGHEFHHVGTIASEYECLTHSRAFVSHGRLPYEQVVRVIVGAQCGVLFVSEHSFETTTKVFDYLAAGIDILICTAGDTMPQTLSKMLNGRPGVHQCKNKLSDLYFFLDNFVPTPPDIIKAAFGDQFSRRASSETLINVLDGI